MSKKRGMLQSEVFTYALMSIGIILLLILAANFISKFQEKKRVIEYEQVKDEIRNMAKLLANDIGTVKAAQFSRPDDLKYLCMVDLAHKDKAMEHQILSRYPEVLDVLSRSDIKRNTFLLSENEVLDMAYIEFLCPRRTGTYCKSNPTDIFELYFIGVPGCTDVSGGSGSGSGGGGGGCSDCNNPNPYYFCGQEVGQDPITAIQECNAIFLIEDTDTTPYQYILQGIPATKFPALSIEFPYFAYYTSTSSTFTKGDVVDLIEQKKAEGYSNVDTAIILNGDPALEDNSYLRGGFTYKIFVRDITTPSSYINFWQNDTIKSISLVPTNSEPIALKAALHAAKMSSSPLFFVGTAADIDSIGAIKKPGDISLLSGGIKVYAIESAALGITFNSEVDQRLQEFGGNISIAPRDVDSEVFLDELAGPYGDDTRLAAEVAPKTQE